MARTFVSTSSMSIEFSDNNVFSPSVNDMTILIWSKLPSTPASQFLFAKGTTNQYEWGVNSLVTTGLMKAVVWISNGAEHMAATGTTDVSDDTWYLHGLKIDYLTRLDVYVKGVSEANDTTTSGTMTNGTAPIRMAGRYDGAAYLDGDLAHFVVFNTLLSDNHILALQNGVNPIAIGYESNLQLYCPTHGNDSPEPDYSGNNRTGTLNNTPTKTSSNPPVELLENYL